MHNEQETKCFLMWQLFKRYRKQCLLHIEKLMQYFLWIEFLCKFEIQFRCLCTLYQLSKSYTRSFDFVEILLLNIVLEVAKDTSLNSTVYITFYWYLKKCTTSKLITLVGHFCRFSYFSLITMSLLVMSCSPKWLFFSVKRGRVVMFL